jgi:sugar phosphate permease
MAPTKSEQRLMLVLLIVGYAGYYLCRANFSVAKPLLLEAFPTMTKESLGLIASVGTFAYSLGKFLLPAQSDRFGARPMFLAGMGGAILFSLMFALVGPALFIVAWTGNRFVQSAGWGAMVRVVGHWIPPQEYGKAMGWVSLSYLFGDFASRMLLSSFIARGATWQQIFLVGAVGLSLIFIPTWLLLREQPGEKSAVREIQRATPQEKRSLFQNPSFWLVCGVSFSFTLMRETFNEWTPLILNERAGLDKANAGFASSLFPLFGGLSVLAVGAWSDRLKKGRLAILPGGLLAGAVLLGLLTTDLSRQGWTSALLIGFTAFALIGPYSLLAGSISLDFGGKTLGATASGWIDGVGYVGGILSGYVMASIAQRAGWPAAMGTLAGLCLVTAAALAIIRPKPVGQFGDAP